MTPAEFSRLLEQYDHARRDARNANDRVATLRNRVMSEFGDAKKEHPPEAGAVPQGPSK